MPPMISIPLARSLRFGLLLVMLAGAPAFAARFVTVEDECNGRQLVIQGPIEAGDYERFVDYLARLVAGGDLPDVQNPDVLWTVKLDSPGGDLGEAMRIGRVLRRAYATTDVSYRFAQRPDGVWDFQKGGELVCLAGDGRLAGCQQDIVEAECTGACLLMWLAGTERHANEGRLGLHGLAGGRTPELAAYLTEMGVSEVWADRMLGLARNGDGWLAWPERHELSGRADALRALVAGCPAPLDRDQSFLSVTAESAELRDRLMDQAEANRSCRRDRLAAARAETVAWLENRLPARGESLARLGADPHTGG